MQKTLITLCAAAALAAPAFAASMTVSFAGSDGTVTVMTFAEDGTASVEGVDATFAYTWDDDAQKLCGDYTGEGVVCATFEGDGGDREVGDTVAYTTDDGRDGVATVTAIK